MSALRGGQLKCELFGAELRTRNIAWKWKGEADLGQKVQLVVKHHVLLGKYSGSDFRND